MEENIKLTWKQVLEYCEKNNSINNDWFVKNKISLADKFFIIGLLNDYAQGINETEGFIKNYDAYIYEVYKRMLILGYYLGMIPIISDCSTELYEQLENKGIFDDIITKLPCKEDYNEFISLADKYVNIDMQVCLSNLENIINKSIEELQATSELDLMASTFNENKELIDKVNNIIDFENPRGAEIIKTIEEATAEK